MTGSESEDVKLLRETCEAFCHQEVDPVAAELDLKRSIPESLIRKMSDLGLFGILIPQQWGGAGMDRHSGVVVVEELSRGCAGIGLMLSVHTFLTSSALLRFGTRLQKDEFLPLLASGRRLGCFCLTEADAGSDIAALSMTATPTEDGWVLDGTKTMVTNAVSNGVAIVFAREPETSGRLGISAFLVPLDLAGIEFGELEPLLGVRSARVSSVTFRCVKISKPSLSGKHGQGFGLALACLGSGRLGIGAQAVGIARAALDQALLYTQEREQFGVPIVANQGIEWKLADMAVALDVAKLMVHAAAQQSKEQSWFGACCAKWIASDSAVKVATGALQVHGGYGYIKEFPAERLYRDAKVTQIYGGTTEVLKRSVGTWLAKKRTVDSWLTWGVEQALSEEARQWVEKLRSFSQDYLVPVSDALDRAKQMNIVALERGAQEGFSVLNVPKSEGGHGIDPTAFSLIMMTLGQGCASFAVTVSVTNMVAEAIARYGSLAQKKRYLRQLRNGDSLAASFALTESGAGSDAAALKTRAVRKGHEYVLSGQKLFVTSGALSNIILVFAKTREEDGHRGISAFLVEKGTPGIEVGKTEDKMGLWGSSTVEIVFSECRVPVSARLGEEGQGLKIALSLLDGGRMSVASQAIGIAHLAFEYARRFSQERVQFGFPISQQPVVQNHLAEMWAKLEAAKLLTFRAAQRKAQNVPFTKEASMAKLFATESANEVCLQAVQMLGAEGLTDRHPIERCLRDCRVTTLYEGTSEIQRIVISRQLSKKTQKV